MGGVIFLILPSTQIGAFRYVKVNVLVESEHISYA